MRNASTFLQAPRLEQNRSRNCRLARHLYAWHPRHQTESGSAQRCQKPLSRRFGTTLESLSIARRRHRRTRPFLGVAARCNSPAARTMERSQVCAARRPAPRAPCIPFSAARNHRSSEYLDAQTKDLSKLPARLAVFAALRMSHSSPERAARIAEKCLDKKADASGDRSSGCASVTKPR